MKELVSFEGPFQIWKYTVSHSELLLRRTRSEGMEHKRFKTRVDVFFKPVAYLQLPSSFNGLKLEEMDPGQIDLPYQMKRDEKLYRLSGEKEVGYVVAYLAAWDEADKSYSDPSKFDFSPDKGLNGYEVFRNQIISFILDMPKKLKVVEERTIVLGVVVDIPVGEGLLTFHSSQYVGGLFSSYGDGLAGSFDGDKEKKAIALVKEAQNYLPLSLATNEKPLPDKNFVRFYLLTNKGMFTAQEKIDNLKNKTSKWSEYFDRVNEIIRPSGDKS